MATVIQSRYQTLLSHAFAMVTPGLLCSLASTFGLPNNDAQVELVVDIRPAHPWVRIVDGTLVNDASSIRAEHIAFVFIAEDRLLITPKNARLPAAADTSTAPRRVGACGAIGQMSQEVDALADTTGVGKVVPAHDSLALAKKLGHFIQLIKVYVRTVTANLQLCDTGAYPRGFDSPP